jgi:hypothetical protein
MDGLMGAKARRVALADIARVEIEPGGAPKIGVSGGLRRRMRLDLRDGASELLLVSPLEERIAQVRAAIADAE